MCMYSAANPGAHDASPSVHHPGDAQVSVLLQTADQQLVRAEQRLVAAISWSLGQQHPHAHPSAAFILCKATSLDLLSTHMRVRSAKRLVKVRLPCCDAQTGSGPPQHATHQTRKAAKLQPSLVASDALVDYLPLSTMMFSPDFRVEQVQQSKLAESLSSVKRMRKAVQTNLMTLSRGLHTPPVTPPAASGDLRSAAAA